MQYDAIVSLCFWCRYPAKENGVCCVKPWENRDRILWRRPGHDEDELVELLPPSDGMCQIAAVDGVHMVNPDEITWNRSMPKRCD